MRPLTIVGIAIVLISGGVVLALVGRPNHCDVRHDLAVARLLDDAVAVNDGGCKGDHVERDRERAAEDFAVADAYAAAGTTARATAASAQAAAKGAKNVATTLKPANSQSNAAEERAAKADDAELQALVDGLVRDPFRAARLTMLNRVIARFGELSAEHADTACSRAATLAGGGLPDQASQLIGRTVLADTGGTCRAAVTAVNLAHAAALKASAAAEADRARHDGDKARLHDARALQTDASLTASHEALVAAAHDNDTALDDTIDGIAAFPGWLSGAWPALVALAVGLLALAALIFRVVRRLAATRRGVRGFLLPEGKKPSWLGRRLARLHVQVGTFAGGKDGELDGGDVAALIEHSLTPRGPAAFPFDRLPAAATTDQTLNDVATFLGNVPKGGAIASALMKLVPSLFAPQTAVVTGRLLPADGAGAGIALMIAAPALPYEERVLREHQIDPAPLGSDGEQHARLVVPASVWVRRRLELLAGDDKDAITNEQLEAEMLATAGEAWSAANDPVRASTCYVRALDANPSLLPAMHNLAVAELRIGAYDAAAERLEEVLVALDYGADAELKWPGLLESVLYNLALAYVYAS